MNSLQERYVHVYVHAIVEMREVLVRPFTLNYVMPHEHLAVATPPYRFNASLQLNVLPDGRLVVTDRTLLKAAGTTTSTAGSQTHFDD